MSNVYYCEDCEAELEDCECHTDYRALKKAAEQRRKKVKQDE